MLSMATKGWTSKVSQKKGKSPAPKLSLIDFSINIGQYSFGWVNASYIYGLQFISTDMKRALGTVTPYDVYEKAQQAREEKFFE